MPAIYDAKEGSIKPAMITEDESKKGPKDPRAKIVDPELSEIVFVKKD